MIFKDINSVLTRVMRHWIVVVLTFLVVINIVAWQQVPGPSKWQTLMCIAGCSSDDCAARLANGVRYSSSAQLVVVPSPKLELTDVPRVVTLLNNNTVIGTCVDVLESPVVVNSAMEQIGVPAGERQTYTVRIFQQPESNVLTLTIEGPNEAVTEQISGAMQTKGREFLGRLFPLYTLDTLEANPRGATVVPSNWQLRIVLAAVVGLGLGIFLALWYDIISAARTPHHARPIEPSDQPRDTQVLPTRIFDQ